jgi:aryl-alcohol dehydrogenase-like predicted oxidoreductase
MISEKQRFSRYVTLQPEYSLIVRATEWELLPLCREEGLGVLAWSPLAGGWLTGKYKRGKELPPDSRAGRKDRWDDQAEQRAGELTWRVLDALESVAAATGKSIPQIALNWLLQQPGLTAPVIGARTPQQLEDNLGSTGWKLDAEHMQVLDQASAIPKPYPYRFVDRYTRKR